MKRSSHELRERVAALEAENDRLRAQLNANCLQRDALQIRVAASEEALAEMGNAMEAGAYDAAWTIRNAALARTTPAPEGKK